jgi:hypothetical protein
MSQTKSKLEQKPSNNNKGLFRTLAVMGLSAGLNLLNPSSDTAQASGTPLDLKPGQTTTLNLNYSNAGDEDMNAGFLEVYIGNAVTLDLNQIYDTYDGGERYQVSPTLVRSPFSFWGNYIKYTPGSANSATGPSGNNTGGLVPAGKGGVLTVTVTLKSDIYQSGEFQVGDVLTPVLGQGVRSELKDPNAQSQPGSLDIKLLAADTSSSSSSDTTSSSTSSSLSSSVSSTSSSQVSSSSSSIDPNAIYGCPRREAGTDCRLYFTSTDNAVMNWNPLTKFNLNYSQNQLYGSGDIKVEFSDIKLSNNSPVADGRTCTFNIYRYGKDEILRTFTATTQAGKCMVTFPKAQQTVNYYTVIATVNDTLNGEQNTMTAFDRIVTYVGGIGNTGEGSVEL